MGLNPGGFRVIKVRRKGFTLIELLVVVAIIALLISILLPSLSRARELAKRAVCRANARGIAQSCHLYSNDNREWFPVAPYLRQTGGGSANQVLAFNYVGQLGFQLETQTSLTTNPHPSRSLFLLVIGNQTTVKGFVCPSSGDQEDNLRNQNGTNIFAAQPGVTRFDFKSFNNLSYGYMMPYGRFAPPRTDLDPRMPLGADRGPWFQAGVTNNATGVTPDQLPNGLTPPMFDGATLPQEILNVSNDRWRPYNSGNHSSEGQVIYYADGHADFQQKPIAGVNNDNIYTWTQRGPQLDNLINSLLGNIPTTNSGPGTDTDSFIGP